MTRLLGLLCSLALCLVPAAAGTHGMAPPAESRVEVVVTLSAPPLAGRGDGARSALDSEQTHFVASLKRAIPAARIRWRYRIVLNGAAVVLPSADIPRLRALPGVEFVDVGAAYRLARTSATDLRSAARRWQSGLPNRGDGMKIGIIDDGIDQTHPYFSPAGFTMPPGYPRGQKAYTTAKVIVARAFAPPGTTSKDALKPFDRGQSEHGTHVAGIAAGNADTPAGGGILLSGEAPRAYLGNYKALSVPTDADVGLDGNAAEIVAAVEAAVADGMNVINLSIGEPEVEPSRDLVALALDGAARAGVVPVVAAGNDFEEFGRGSLSSPGTSELAITVAAVTTPDGRGQSTLASFSGGGPTPISLRLKPDVSAPGVGILSSIPGGRFETLSGTSMASPQIAGTAALLRERHPDWPVASLKAALIGSGTPVSVNGKVAPPTREGGGLAAPTVADTPLVLASPASVSLGFVRPGATTDASVTLADAGGGPDPWSVTVENIVATSGATLVVPSTISAPGTLALSAVVAPDAAEGDLTGFVTLTRGTDVRRIPYWLRVIRPGLAGAKARTIRTPGDYVGDTRGKPSLANHYRYPDVPADSPASGRLLGPEQVFRFVLSRPVANFGVVITRHGRGSHVEPRVVVAGDENRLTGYAALPINLNPYLSQFFDPVLAAGAVRPIPGEYELVFDSPTRAGAGSYGFRFWIDDTKPPTAKLDSTRVRRGAPLVARLSDAGSGVDPSTLKIVLDGAERTGRIRDDVLRIPTDDLRPGRHILRLQVSDYQESRNMENVPPILPNTRVLTTTVVVR